MIKKNSLVRPGTLIEGAEYLIVEQDRKRRAFVMAKVKFLSYNSSPAFVVVSTGTGKRILCPREDLFTLSNRKPF